MESEAEGTCDAHAGTLATWVHHCTGHGNPSTTQDWASTQGIMTLAHVAKEAWQICLDCPLDSPVVKEMWGHRVRGTSPGLSWHTDCNRSPTILSRGLNKLEETQAT